MRKGAAMSKESKKFKKEKKAIKKAAKKAGKSGKDVKVDRTDPAVKTTPFSTWPQGVEDAARAIGKGRWETVNRRTFPWILVLILVAAILAVLLWPLGRFPLPWRSRALYSITGL
jgi:hypothetical protein